MWKMNVGIVFGIDIFLILISTTLLLPQMPRPPPTAKAHCDCMPAPNVARWDVTEPVAKQNPMLASGQGNAAT